MTVRSAGHWLFILTALWTPRALADGVAERAAFQRWATEFAASHEAFVQDWWSAKLESTERGDYVARLCSTSQAASGFYLIQAGDDRWSLQGTLPPTRFGRGTVTAGEKVSHLPGCATAKPPRPAPRLRTTEDRSLVHQGFDSREWEEVAIAIRDGEPRIILDRGGSFDDGHTTFRHDWERLVETSTRFGANGKPVLIHENAITPVVEQHLAVPTWNTTLAGHAAGRAPAISLAAEASGGSYTLHVTVVDDKIVAGKGGDRIDVILCDPRLKESCLRRIEIASDAAAFWTAGALDGQPSLPRVIGRARDQLDLELPAALASRYDGIAEIGLTVLYRDVDVAGGPTVAVVATGRVVEKDEHSLGRIIERAHGSRYPGVESAENAGLLLKKESATAARTSP